MTDEGGEAASHESDLARRYLELGGAKSLKGAGGFRRLFGEVPTPEPFTPQIPDYRAMVDLVRVQPDDSPKRSADAAVAANEYLRELSEVMTKTLEVNQETMASNRRMLELNVVAQEAAGEAQRHTRRVANISLGIAAASLAASLATIGITIFRG